MRAEAPIPDTLLLGVEASRKLLGLEGLNLHEWVSALTRRDRNYVMERERQSCVCEDTTRRHLGGESAFQDVGLNELAP